MYPLVFHDHVEVGYMAWWQARYHVTSPQPLHWALESGYNLLSLIPIYGAWKFSAFQIPHFLLLRRPEITHNATNPGFVRAHQDQQGSLAAHRAENPGLMLQSHLESKPSSAETATAGCSSASIVLKSRMIPLDYVFGLNQAWGWWIVAAHPYCVSCEC